MTTAKQFVEALQANGNAEGQSVDDFWKTQRDRWVADLTDLRRSIVRWLAPVVEAKLATVKDLAFDLMEPGTGAYRAPGLEIALLAAVLRRVVVRPRGLRIAGIVQPGGARVLGARGRVDLECGLARESLLRFGDDGPTTWVSVSGGEKKALDEDLFFDLVVRMADLDLR